MSLFSFFGVKDNKYVLPGIVAVAIIISALAIMITQSQKPIADQSASASETPVVTDAKVGSYISNRTPVLQKGDKIFGSEKAILKIFVYEDYTNPLSAALADTLEKIQAEEGDKIALIARPFILNNSGSGIESAVAIDCAGAQGKWREMRALLFARAKNKQAIGADFGTYVRQIGLDEKDFGVCLTNEEKSGKIEQSVTEAAGYSVLGTPTMFVGEEMIIGARPYEDFVDSNGDKIQGLKALIDRKLNEVQKGGV